MRKFTLLMPIFFVIVAVALTAVVAFTKSFGQEIEGEAAFTWPNGAKGAVSLSWAPFRPCRPNTGRGLRGRAARGYDG